ncbi:MAG: hypothetical protein JO114_19990 [Planctomycetaceae bacterium]|nr:hypothetical protein [Planctomycetaceae bacterium]MBV8310802.1 hypothetical protein [Planctomycetaceae bacterium]
MNGSGVRSPRACSSRRRAQRRRRRCGRQPSVECLRKVLTFRPSLSMNDYAGLAAALLSGAGIGDLPPLVRPELLDDGRLVEVMPKWRFRTVDLSAVHLGNRHVSRSVRLFRAFAAKMAPTLFPALPT